MQIEDQDEDIQEEGCWICCLFCRRETDNPDLNRSHRGKEWLLKKPYFETGFLIPVGKREWSGKTLEMIRRSNMTTKHLPDPLQAIRKNNKKAPERGFSGTTIDMNVNDINNLLRRRLSLRVLISEEDQSGERGEAILPQKSNFTEAAPILLSHLVKGTDRPRRSSVKPDMIERFKSSFAFSKSSVEDLSSSSSYHIFEDNEGLEQKSDKEFLEYLIRTSHFMKEALEKDWLKTKNYVRWIENYVKSPKFAEKARASPEKWMVVLYTSSEDSRDQLTNFRCMLVRLLLQHHCVVYEERDIMLQQFESEFQDRLLGDRQNIPQVFMQGFNIGGYRVMYAIHKLDMTKNIFQKFIMPQQGYAEWMFNKESKSAQLNLDVNLKAFPALQALAGSWSNNKLSPAHLEFVTMGKFVVKHAREHWYQLSARPYMEPDLRRYALLRLTIIQTLCAMNKIYKQYVNKIEPEGAVKLRRKLSWLPRFSKQLPKD